MALGCASSTSIGFSHLAGDYLKDEAECLEELVAYAQLDDADRRIISEMARAYSADIRKNFTSQSFVDHLLQEYGLSSEAGVQIMRLCEALIRTPDFATSGLLIRDKLSGVRWAHHAGASQSFLVNRATNGLQLANAWVSASGGVESSSFISKVGDRSLVSAMSTTMRVLGGHFVFAETIAKALKKAQKTGALFSFDMLGEAAHTQVDSDRYFQAYLSATEEIARQAQEQSSVESNHGISVKLSALHPRYEFAQRSFCVPALVKRLIDICAIAKRANIGVTIDAEECDRLEVSLMVLERLLKSPELDGWDGLGFVVQAYQRRALRLVTGLIQLSRDHNKRLNIRLVKGAYWDAEIKRAQELGLDNYPVFTRRENTDVSYLACARKLLDARDTVYPQFASHNAHSLAAIQHMAGKSEGYELQRLHGMGERLHEIASAKSELVSRVYAPIGNHKDLLPYLVRRLIENGANSSFLNQLMDDDLPIDALIYDPVEKVQSGQQAQHPDIPHPRDICEGGRQSAEGLDFTQHRIEQALHNLGEQEAFYRAASIVDGEEIGSGIVEIRSPARPSDLVGEVSEITATDVERAVVSASQSEWATAYGPSNRAAIFGTAADILEQDADKFLKLCVSEAGKTFPDAIAEVREAIDFCRYYAAQCKLDHFTSREPLGVVACISPWNFPIAIFLGQVSAALCAGNTVVAKPAPQTPLIAAEAVKLLHKAGVPNDALHLLIGPPQETGNALTGHHFVGGVCFTGSTKTAKIIAARLADTGRADTPFIAETGGINAMIVDSTALTEQAVSDVVASAFQSAGQRCSACRIVCVQADIYDAFKAMLIGAMRELKIGDPAHLSTDVGPLIDEAAHQNVQSYVEAVSPARRVLFQTPYDHAGASGHFFPPTLIELDLLSDLKQEIFGPVLNLVSFNAGELDEIIDQINASGYGLTLGLHSRIDARVKHVAKRTHVGNLYVSRNQIGAVVGVQPFGGEGLSGTGPKAGGPNYLYQLTRARPKNERQPAANLISSDTKLDFRGEDFSELIQNARKAGDVWTEQTILRERRDLVQGLLQPTFDLGAEFWSSLSRDEVMQLPGPTGEFNSLSLVPRGVLVCARNDRSDIETLARQVSVSLVSGSAVLIWAKDSEATEMDDFISALATSPLPPKLVAPLPSVEIDQLANLPVDGFVADGPIRSQLAAALNKRSGAILPLLSARDPIERYCHERTLTINTTAAGGNTSLLSLD